MELGRSQYCNLGADLPIGQAGDAVSVSARMLRRTKQGEYFAGDESDTYGNLFFDLLLNLQSSSGPVLDG